MAVVYDRNLGVYKDSATGQTVNQDGSPMNSSGASQISDEEFGRSMGAGDNAFAGAFLPAQSADDVRDANIARHQATQETTARTNAPFEAQKQNAKPTVYDDIRRSAEAGRGAGIELPFIRHAPGGRILEGAVEGALGGTVAAADYVYDNPGKSLLTGGIAPAIAGVDHAADKVASGVAEEIQGTERADVNLPLTPGQLYEPNGPLYDPGNIDGSGRVNVPGLKDIGEGIASGVSDIAGGIGDFFDFGGGRGGGGAGGVGAAAAPALQGAMDSAERLRGMGANVPGANPADAQRQGDALDQAMAFMDGPRATQGAMADVQRLTAGPGAQGQALGEVQATRAAPGAQAGILGQAQQAAGRPGELAGVMPGIDQFLAGPQGPSAAEIQLRQAQDDSMSDALSLARSARGGAGATNRALRVAMAENAATQSGTARDLSLLRAKEEEARRDETLRGLGLKSDVAQGMDQRELQALGLSGDLARGVDQRDLEALGLSAQLSQGIDDRALRGAGIQADLARGLDQDTLQSLGLSGELATAMRNAGVQERGQSLDFTRGMEQTAAGLQGDVLSAIPQLEQVRHADQYDLTPDEKLRMALLGAGGDILSTFF